MMTMTVNDDNLFVARSVVVVGGRRAWTAGCYKRKRASSSLGSPMGIGTAPGQHRWPGHMWGGEKEIHKDIRLIICQQMLESDILRL
jgi:hypothetical protein